MEEHSNLYFSKPPRRFWFMLKFENHWSKPVVIKSHSPFLPMSTLRIRMNSLQVIEIQVKVCWRSLRKVFLSDEESKDIAAFGLSSVKMWCLELQHPSCGYKEAWLRTTEQKDHVFCATELANLPMTRHPGCLATWENKPHFWSDTLFLASESIPPKAHAFLLHCGTEEANLKR